MTQWIVKDQAQISWSLQTTINTKAPKHSLSRDIKTGKIMIRVLEHVVSKQILLQRSSRLTLNFITRKTKCEYEVSKMFKNSLKHFIRKLSICQSIE
jgi:hypothetical protein